MKNKLLLLSIVSLLLAGCSVSTSLSSTVTSSTFSSIPESSSSEEESRSETTSSSTAEPISSSCETTSSSTAEPISSSSEPSSSSTPEPISSSTSEPISSSSEPSSSSTPEPISSSTPEPISSSTPEPISSSSEPSSSVTIAPSSSSSSSEHGEYDVSKYYDGYYTSIVSWKNSEDLISQLHKLIKSTYNGITYVDPNWETNQFADQALDNFMNVDAVYSKENFLKTSTSTSWQREHAFCASAMTGFSTTVAVDIHDDGFSRATDFHNLFAAYSSGNSVRNNNGFAISTDRSYVPTGTGDYLYDTSNKTFEPSDYDKGRLARGILYMCVMYNEDEYSQIKQASVSYGGGRSKTKQVVAKYKPLTLTENYEAPNVVTLNAFANSEKYADLRIHYLGEATTFESICNGDETKFDELIEPYVNAYVDYRYENYDFNMGKKSDILKWATEYSVDRLEYQHNESVCKHVYSLRQKAQGNRNPFVDYPELVSYCFGDKKNQPGSLNKIEPSAHQLNIDTDPKALANYAIKDHKLEFFTGETFTKDDYSIVKVNNDFTYEETTDYVDSTSSYTFKESDIGTKKLQVKINEQIIDLFVNVRDGGMESCKYKKTLDKNDFTVNTMNGEFNFDDTHQWTYETTNKISTCSNDKAKGVKFGKSGAAVGSITLTSKDSFTNVNAFYFSGNVASGLTINYKLYVGETIVCNGNYTYSKEATGKVEFGSSFTNASGKLKLVITNATNAIYLSVLAFNY